MISMRCCTADAVRWNCVAKASRMERKGSLERAKGIEPSYAAWEAAVLPLNYAREVLRLCTTARTIAQPSRFCNEDRIKTHAALTKRASSGRAAEMLGQFQPLPLIVRGDAGAVQCVGLRQHLLINEATDDLTVFENEGHLARAHLEHRTRSLPARARIAEAGVEEARVMDAEFADQRIERHHFGGEIRRHLHRFFRRENVELARIENEAAVGASADRLPEILHREAAAPVDIDAAGVTLRAEADEPVGALARQIDTDRDAAYEIGVVAIDKALTLMQRLKLDIVELRRAGPKTDLR